MTPPVPGRKRPLLLVVDDDEMQRYLCRECLDGQFDVIEATEGREAVRRFVADIPDLVLLDVVMPDVDGFATCREIRALADGGTVPILMATGLDDLASIDAAYAAGATDFVSKPLNWGLLPYRIKYLLRSHEMLRQLRLARDEAQSADAAKTAFLATMSHELQTPLNAVIGFAEILASPATANQQQCAAYASCILEAGQRMSGAIDDVLLLARLEGGAWQPQIECLDPYGLVEATVADFCRSAAAAGRTILMTPATSEWASATVAIDERSLRRMLGHLLSNAVKFSPAERPVVVKVDRAADGHYRVTVVDGGIGMDAAQVAAAVRSFRQLDASLAREYSGMGLGLSITARLIAAQGGRLEIDSAPQQGTRAILHFPIAAAAAVELPATLPDAVAPAAA